MKKSAKWKANQAKKKPAAKAPPKHVPTPGLYGWITHTDLASLNPLATKAWCAKVLGWTSLPYLHVKSCQASFDLAIREGATEMLAPTRVMEGVPVAIVLAPCGVPIGFSGPYGSET